jgi:hypothetical protein
MHVVQVLHNLSLWSMTFSSNAIFNQFVHQDAIPRSNEDPTFSIRLEKAAQLRASFARQDGVSVRHRANGAQQQSVKTFPLHRAIKDQGMKNFSFEVIKMVDYIDEQHLLIIESCYMDKYDSISNGYNTKYSVDMYKLY